MDLTRFTKVKKKEKEEVLLDNSEIKVVKSGKSAKIKIKDKDSIAKYHSILFFAPTENRIVRNDEEAQEFFEESIKEGTEGLMFKSLSAIYKPGLRTGALAKIKEVKEDIDVVILGAEHGKGKRAGFYSTFYVGVFNEDYMDESEMYLEVGKVSSGVKELEGEGATLERLTSLLKPLKTSEDRGVIRFEPKIVIQVRYQEIQKSTAYNSGYALRFPRIVLIQ